jgi:hypothetical protein
MRRQLILVLAAFAYVSYVSAAPTAATLCSPEEQVIFSCITTKNKVISLCSSSVLTNTVGYLQYRFGAAGQTPELSYPKAHEHPKKHFQSGTMMYSGGGGAYLKFNSGEYIYTVFTGIGKGWEKEGVVVERGGKQIGYLQCQGPTTSEIGPALFEKIQIRKDPNDYEFVIP